MFSNRHRTMLGHCCAILGALLTFTWFADVFTAGTALNPVDLVNRLTDDVQGGFTLLLISLVILAFGVNTNLELYMQMFGGHERLSRMKGGER